VSVGPKQLHRDLPSPLPADTHVIEGGRLDLGDEVVGDRTVGATDTDLAAGERALETGIGARHLAGDDSAVVIAHAVDTPHQLVEPRRPAFLRDGPSDVDGRLIGHRAQHRKGAGRVLRAAAAVPSSVETNDVGLPPALLINRVEPRQVGLAIRLHDLGLGGHLGPRVFLGDQPGLVDGDRPRQ